MQRGSLARWLVVGALACFGFLAGASIASAQETAVQGTNGSSGSVGASGPVAVTNTGAALGGPSAGGLGGVAATQMDGDTVTNLDQTSAGASGPASAGSQISTPASGSKTQDTNVSTGAVSVSGPVVVGNAAVVHAGPSSLGVGGTAVTSQSGDDIVSATQVAVGYSGPADAGSQILTGGSGDALTQGTNVSLGAVSLSGGVGLFNLLATQAGPSSVGALGGIAVTGQVGEDDAFITQTVAGASGAAASGSQVVRNSSGTAQPFNNSTAAGALTGPVLAGNALATASGGSAVAAGPGSFAGSNHSGDAAVVGNQVSGGASGNAVVGSQLIGLTVEELGALGSVDQQASDPDFFQPLIDQIGSQLGLGSLADLFDEALAGTGPDGGSTGELTDLLSLIGSGNGDALSGLPSSPTGPAGLGGLGTLPGLGSGSEALVQDANVTAGNLGASGPAISLNGAIATAGPSSAASTTAAGAGATAPGATAVASQDGNATTLVDQDGASLSGDALAGAQQVPALDSFLGVVGDTNLSFGTLAATGPAAALNLGAGRSGPASSALSTATAAAGSTATSGRATATSSQRGDTVTGLIQDATGATGDAMTGSQVEDFGPASVLLLGNFNFAALGAALTGGGTGVNVGGASTGPVSAAASTANATAGTATSGDATSGAVQDGDDDALVDQLVIGSSGNAAFGSQINDADGIGSAAAMRNTNIAGVGLAASGGGLALNSEGVNAGPVTGAASTANATGAGGSATSGRSTSVVGQDGDNTALGLQRTHVSSGDALSASQVYDVNGAGVLLTTADINVSTAAFGASGTALGVATDTSTAGPVAGSLAAATQAGTGVVTVGDAVASSMQSGNNTALDGQLVIATTGDALAGSQGSVVDALGGGLVSGQANVASGSLALSGSTAVALGMNSAAGPVAAAIANGTAGPGAVVNTGRATASANQLGDNLSANAQVGAGATGDAIAGSQARLFGILGGLVTAGGLNVSTGAAALSGSTAVILLHPSLAGPLAVALPTGAGDATAVAAQIGPNVVGVLELGLGLTGPAAAGSTVLLHAGGGGLYFPVNVSGPSLAVSGPSLALVAFPTIAGTLAFSTVAPSFVAQVGGNLVLLVLPSLGLSGPAIVGTRLDGNLLGFLYAIVRGLAEDLRLGEFALSSVRDFGATLADIARGLASLVPSGAAPAA